MAKKPASKAAASEDPMHVFWNNLEAGMAGAIK
jgi:hypothetical protein